MLHILRKPDGEYTLSKVCEDGAIALSPKPAKYSPEDPYGKYRREAKFDERKKEGLIW